VRPNRHDRNYLTQAGQTPAPLPIDDNRSLHAKQPLPLHCRDGQNITAVSQRGHVDACPRLHFARRASTLPFALRSSVGSRRSSDASQHVCEVAVETSLRSHVGVQRLYFAGRTSARTNGLHLVCCCLECALTHGGAHADCACVPPHAVSGALYHLDLMTKSEVM
jgi:hypothetical protein